MHIRFAMIAAATLVSASAFAAEPAKPPVQPAAQPQAAPQPVLLASAGDVRAPAQADQSAPTPPKHRVARVTTCRCGEVAAQPEDEQQ